MIAPPWSKDCSRFSLEDRLSLPSVSTQKLSNSENSLDVFRRDTLTSSSELNYQNVKVTQMRILQ
eukprot:c38547_g1_i1 orf=19-213(-)